MARVGVNLRQEDIPDFLQACKDAGVDFKEIPVWYCCHDDTEAIVNAAIGAAVNAGLWVQVWRCMVNDSRLLPTRIPDHDIYGNHSGICGWNEADDSSAYPDLPGWVDAWWQWVRSLNRGLVIYYGAPNVDGFLTENKPLEAALDVVCRHIGSTFSPPPSTIEGKPVCVSEIDIDPARFDPNTSYQEVLDCAKRCVEAGEDAFVWGYDPSKPDASLQPLVLKGIIAINSGQSTPAPAPTPAPEPAPTPGPTVTVEAEAEQAYNLLTGGAPMVPGKQYVQDNGDGTFTVVVTYPQVSAQPAPTPVPHLVTGPDDEAVEKANYQGHDETCGERVVAMACAEDNIIPIDASTDQAFALELLDQLGTGLDPNTFGGTNLDQQLGLLQYVARKFNKTLQVVGVNGTDGLRDPNYQHKSIAVNLGPLLNINSNHFLLQRKEAGNVGDGYVKVIDSDRALDYSNDVFSEAQVLAGAAAIFGDGQQFGWAWNWL